MTDRDENSEALHRLAADEQAEREDRAKQEQAFFDRYEKIGQPYDTAWNSLASELATKDSGRAAAAIERLVQTGERAEATERLAWLPQSDAAKQDKVAKGIALTIAAATEQPRVSLDNAAALLTLIGEQHPANSVNRLQRAKPVKPKPVEKERSSGDKTNSLSLLQAATMSPMALGIKALTPEMKETELRDTSSKRSDSESEPTKSMPPQQEEPQPADVEALALLQPSVQKAWATWLLADRSQAITPSDREAYDWIKEKGGDSFIVELVDYRIPAFATWQRQLRTARNAMGQQKNTPRAGRSVGKSVAQASEI